MTDQEIEQLQKAFAAYPYILRTITYFANVINRQLRGHEEAIGYLHDLQKLATELK